MPWASPHLFLLLCLVTGGILRELRAGETVAIPCADPAGIVAPSGREAYVFGTGRGIPFWRSSSLPEWKHVGRVFPDAVPAWARQKVPKADGIWAPDIALLNGKYHIYYSVSSWGSQRSVIGLAVGAALDPADPAYGWEDRGLVVESAPGKTDFNAIDAALCVAHDGKPYLFWGSFWTGIKAAPVDPRTGKLAAGRTTVPVARRARDVHPPAIEAPYVIRRDGHYYLFVSWGFTCKGKDSTYRVMVGRSKAVLGPYVDFDGKKMVDGGGTLVLASHGTVYGPGHNSVLHVGKRDWLLHHVDNPGVPRRLQLRRMHWLDGWPVAGEPAMERQQRPLSRLAVSDFAGTWHHSVDYGRPSTIKLRSDGAVDGGGRWSHGKGRVVFRWRSPEAPGGVWTDTLIVAPDGRSYVGRNQKGQIIRGVKK